MKQVLTGLDKVVALVIWIVALAPIASLDATGGVWDIEPANVTYDEWTDIFTMKFGLDPIINETENLRVDILLPNCSYPKLGVDDGIVYDYINASGYFIFEVHPWTMSFDERLFNYSYWENTTDPNAVIDLCVLAELWTGPESDPNATQVNSLETIVTLYIDLTETTDIDFNVVQKANPENEAIEEETFDVFAYFCDPYTKAETDPNPVFQGELLTVCVEVTERTLLKGVYIDYIEEFAWIRDNSAVGIPDIHQQVIKDAALVDPYISIYNCVPPLVVCDFSGFMWSEFFAQAGTAIGVGMARLVFGNPDDSNSTNSTSSTRSRILWRGGDEGRSYRALQDALQGESDPPGAFGLNLTLSQGGNTPRLKTAGGVTVARPWKNRSILISNVVMGIAVCWTAHFW